MARTDGDPVIERAARSVTIVASLLFAGAIAWELTGPFDAGHDAATTAVGIAAMNMWRWGIVAPVTHFSASLPTPDVYYCHHPWGVFWTTALLVGGWGGQDWVLRLAPLVMSAATPPLLFLVARRLYGAGAGAAAAVTFAATPIALAFADFNALEVPVMFGCLLGAWGLIRFAEERRWRWLAVSLIGLGHAMNSDWAAFVFVGVLLAAGPLSTTPGSEGHGAPWHDRHARAAWLLLAGWALVIGGGYLLLFLRLGQLQRLLQQGVARTAGISTPLAALWVARRHWLELSFTPVGLGLGLVAVPVLLWRYFARGNRLEVIPLAVLSMATFQYFVFKNGADVHVFWPHYYALHLAFGVAAIAASLEPWAHSLAARLTRRDGSPRIRHPARLAFAIGLLPALVMAPDALATLTYARRTGKRFDDGWRLIAEDGDKHAVARWVAHRFGPTARIAVHSSMHLDWSLEWALRRAVVPAERAAVDADVVLVDARFAAPELLSLLASAAPVSTYGPYWVVEPRAPWRPLTANRISRVEPTLWRWYWVDGNDPEFGFTPDPYGTWELRDHLGQVPNPPPAAAPDDTEDLRVARAMALTRGDVVAAAHHLDALLERIEPRPTARYPDGTELLGFALLGGVVPRVRVYVRAGPTAPARGLSVRVVSRVDERPWSTVSAPHRDREVGMPFILPPALWKPGRVYVTESEIRRQPGVDTYSVEVTGAGLPGARTGSARAPLFTLR
jgi:hypothetical protein